MFNREKTWGQFDKNISPISLKILIKYDTFLLTHVFQKKKNLSKKKRRKIMTLDQKKKKTSLHVQNVINLWKLKLV